MNFNTYKTQFPFESLLSDISNIYKKEFTGDIYFIGVGKSLKIAEAISDSFKSVGVKAYSIDANNALHGDIGVININDILIFISRTGNTKELIDCYKRALIVTNGASKNNSYAICCNPESYFANEIKERTLILPDEPRSPFDMIPIYSLIYTYQLCLMLFEEFLKRERISNHDFLKYHPKGIGEDINGEQK